MFPELFGGGNARLVMTGDEILDSGVQVMAQPPGKKNQTIHLLSGGEKALTAIALVFAIFQLNPAPFCLLDEVDAPLDDANTERYAKLVTSMSRETQFLFISHNKIAMEMAEQLIGVTMQEQGVSRIVAVDMESAVSHGGSRLSRRHEQPRPSPSPSSAAWCWPPWSATTPGRRAATRRASPMLAAGAPTPGRRAGMRRAQPESRCCDADRAAMPGDDRHEPLFDADLPAPTPSCRAPASARGGLDPLIDVIAPIVARRRWSRATPRWPPCRPRAAPAASRSPSKA